MDKATKPDKPLTNRQKLFVDYLPAYNWNFTQAAIAAGFTQSYADKKIHNLVKTNSGLSRAIEAKRLKTTVEKEDLREEVEKFLSDTMRDAKQPRSVRLKAADGLMKMGGWQSQTINLEGSGRQRELDARRNELVSRELNAAYNLPILPARPAADVQVYETVPLSNLDREPVDIPNPCDNAPQANVEPLNTPLGDSLSNLDKTGEPAFSDGQRPFAPPTDEPTPYPSIPKKISGISEVRECDSQGIDDSGDISDGNGNIPHRVRPIPVSEQIARFGVRVKEQV